MRGLWCLRAMPLILLLLPLDPVSAVDSLTPGSILTDATTQNIGIRWQIVGDDDLDAECSVRFRPQGTTAWLEGISLIRPSPLQTGGENRLSGSIFFLESNSNYEIELTLSDPDGGGDQQVITETTEAKLTSPMSPTDYWVEPGNGGGSGSELDPFRGLQEAADHAHQGAVFHVLAGSYEPFNLATSGVMGSPIVFRGPVDPQADTEESHWAIVDGGGTAISAISLGDMDPTAYIVLEYLVIQNSDFAVVARNTQQILFRRNYVRNVDNGFYNNRYLGLERYQVLTDNVFVGRQPWPGTGVPGSIAIHLRGTANEVAHNEISYFGQGIMITPTNPDADGSDVYLNDISFIVSDPLEIASHATNSRVWRNRVVNAISGVSLSEVLGGPVYVFRNEFFNVDYSAYKMVLSTSGLVFIHNTSNKLEDGITSLTDGWENTFLRNNIVLGTRYAVAFWEVVGLHDWDYDALGTTRGPPVIKWYYINYDTVEEFADGTGQEVHGIPALPSDLLNATLPLAYGDGVPPGSYDLRLAASTPEIDTGVMIPNINDPFVSDGMPDRGAFEFGSDLPDYGPRPPGMTSIGDRPYTASLPLHLYPTVPNPFNPHTTVSFSVNRAQHVTISVYDLTGRLVTVVADQMYRAGTHNAEWDSKDIHDRAVSSGTYFVRMEAEGYVKSQKIMLVR